MTNSIPSACAVDAMAVTIGTETIGFVVHRDSSYFAFDTNEQLIGEYPNQRAAMRSLNRCCTDCKVNTFAIGEYYMVRAEVWQQAGGSRGMLCIGCLERRIGRKLQQSDFIDCPLNREQLRRSARLKNRMAAGPKLTQPQN